MKVLAAGVGAVALALLGFSAASASISSPPCWSNSPHKTCPPPTTSTSASTSTAQTTIQATTTAATTTVATTTTATTTTTAAGSVAFDGRAKNMTALSSYETTPGDLSTLVQTQSPVLWDCLCFLNNDIQLAADSRYGKAYAIRTGANSQNPWSKPTNAAGSELSRRQVMTLGTWDWYANSYRVHTGWVQPDWAVLFQFGYPTLSSPPVAIDADHTTTGVPTLQLYMNAGLLTANSAGWYGGTQRGDWTIAPIPLGQWIEIIVGVKWATDSTGQVRVYTRIPSQTSAWTLAVSLSNVPTEQYGCTSYGCVNSTFTDSAGNPITVTDHGGLYFGYYGTPPSPFPTNYVDQSGLTRSSDLATAEGTLP